MIEEQQLEDGSKKLDSSARHVSVENTVILSEQSREAQAKAQAKDTITESTHISEVSRKIEVKTEKPRIVPKKVIPQIRQATSIIVPTAKPARVRSAKLAAAKPGPLIIAKLKPTMRPSELPSPRALTESPIKMLVPMAVAGHAPEQIPIDHEVKTVTAPVHEAEFAFTAMDLGAEARKVIGLVEPVPTPTPAETTAQIMSETMELTEQQAKEIEIFVVALPKEVQVRLAEFMQDDDVEAVTAVQELILQIAAVSERLHVLFTEDRLDSAEAVEIEAVLAVWYEELTTRLNMAYDEAEFRHFIAFVRSEGYKPKSEQAPNEPVHDFTREILRFPRRLTNFGRQVSQQLIGHCAVTLASS